MGVWKLALAVAGLGLASCTTVAAAPAYGVESIAYETGPCFGACPVYRVSVNRDGSGLFEGRRFTTVSGERRFQITPDQYRAFVGHLEPLRPSSGEMRYTGDVCGAMATDMPSADVVWRSALGADQHLYFYYGCDMERNRAIADRLRSAPDRLPIGHLIGPAR